MPFYEGKAVGIDIIALVKRLQKLRLGLSGRKGDAVGTPRRIHTRGEDAAKAAVARDQGGVAAAQDDDGPAFGTDIAQCRHCRRRDKAPPATAFLPARIRQKPADAKER